MTDYDIKPRQKERAKLMGLTIKPSTNKKKKIDVFKNKKKIATIGGRRIDGTFYNDYATYIITIGKEKANKKRTNYLKRHSKEPKMKDGKRTNSYYSDKILWA